jgi:hypothetical protein
VDAPPTEVSDDSISDEAAQAAFAESADGKSKGPRKPRAKKKDTVSKKKFDDKPESTTESEETVEPQQFLF